jgi:PAS domain-containing protein
VLLFFVTIFRPEPLSERLLEASKDEYVTRHLIDGRIIDCDQRISFIAGYMTEEVSGLSAFKFMHRDDVRWVMIALRQSEFF